MRKLSFEHMNSLFEIDSSIKEGIRWKVQVANLRIGTPAGTADTAGYFNTKINRKYYRNHRIVFVIHNKVDLADEIIDHIDRDPHNNHPNNLRVVTNIQNCRNRTKQKTTAASKYIGVTRNKQTNNWLARITVNRNRISLGTFKTEEEAAMARNEYIIENNLEYFNLAVL